ncbi:MAG TPA: RNA polymerase sigma-70 factor [Verrucomicrobia bacterium]|nr:MAG: hypothetical protein A2X46_12370 [Lentisphaerae bacterium GWF2_57_35]HBA84086.1 RNA polymerase sigma-70 factor [Verrucomicrobiota bacterium]
MSDEKTDWALVDEIKAGDDRAFDALMERHKRPILNFVYRMLGHASQAEDVVQEVFVRTYQTIRKPGFHQTTEEFSHWLFRVARNAALDGLRRRTRRAEVPFDSATPMAVSTSLPAGREVENREIGERISAAVAELPEDQRTALLLAEYQGLSYGEIARIMRSSKKSVESRLYRAKRNLRGKLTDLLNSG